MYFIGRGISTEKGAKRIHEQYSKLDPNEKKEKEMWYK